jgi:hypothetical protein
MAETENNGLGTGMIVGILIVMLIVVFLFLGRGYMGRGGGKDQPNVQVPDKVDINLNGPTNSK